MSKKCYARLPSNVYHAIRNEMLAGDYSMQEIGSRLLCDEIDDTPRFRYLVSMYRPSPGADKIRLEVPDDIDLIVVGEAARMGCSVSDYMRARIILNAERRYPEITQTLRCVQLLDDIMARWYTLSLEQQEFIHMQTVLMNKVPGEIV